VHRPATVTCHINDALSGAGSSGTGMGSKISAAYGPSDEIYSLAPCGGVIVLPFGAPRSPGSLFPQHAPWTEVSGLVGRLPIPVHRLADPLSETWVYGRSGAGAGRGEPELDGGLVNAEPVSRRIDGLSGH
jgi:hypothetical protein